MKSFQDAWGNGGWLVKGQVNIANEAKFHSPICSTFEVLVVRCVVWHCLSGEEWGPFCWPTLAADTGVFSASHGFFSVSSQGTYSLSFFTFPICKCQLTIEWPAVSSWTASVAVGGSVWMIFSVVIVRFRWLAPALVIVKALVSFAKLLEPPLLSTH